MRSPLGAVNTFEGLSAELLAVAPSDKGALVQIAAGLTDAVALLEPDSPEFTLAGSAQQTLQQIIDGSIADSAAALADLAQTFSSIAGHLQQHTYDSTQYNNTYR